MHCSCGVHMVHVCSSLSISVFADGELSRQIPALYRINLSSLVTWNCKPVSNTNMGTSSCEPRITAVVRPEGNHYASNVVPDS